ncbi:MAG: PD-(D/E)XK nuclease family protein [Candidatus Omnitrophica bacterium]|nr:PD-(D/E)XK nuclease family protein [Candidatus Omnitrophota bacterium]
MMLKSELSWSYSRDRLFLECRRAYYYHYYASWGGWEREASDLSKKAYLLRNIQNLDAWIGDIVHQVIKWILENQIQGNTVLHDEAINKTKQMFLKTWEQSRGKLWVNNVKHNLNLFEHYYNRELSRGFLAEKLVKAQRSITNIYSCGLLETISGLSKDCILRVDELDSFDFEGIKIFAVPDFAIKNELYTLYDWKTGKPTDKDALQLSCYTLYAHDKWKATIDNIQLVPVYLAQEEVSLNPIKALKTEEVKTYIRSSISEMKSCLKDASANIADIDKLPKTNDGWRCKNCRFQEICVPGQKP